MRALPLCLIATISACNSTPVELPEWDFEPSETEIVYPVRLPERPVEAASTAVTVTYDSTGFDRLITYMDVADANYDVGVALARALEAESRSFNHLVEAGKMQRQVAVIRQELLDQERQDHAMDVWWLRGVILFIGAFSL